jgi:hypothetical protein
MYKLSACKASGPFSRLKRTCGTRTRVLVILTLILVVGSWTAIRADSLPPLRTGRRLMRCSQPVLATTLSVGLGMLGVTLTGHLLF